MIPVFEAALSREAALRRATDAFAARGIAPARGDARFLALHALGLTPVDLAVRGGRPLGDGGAAALGAAVARRLAGEPVARIIGAWEFWGLPFALSPATLVPRPDTETVVRVALDELGARDRAWSILDLGTGSGCILVALLCELAQARGIGLDRSHEALVTARGNAAMNGVASRARFVRGDWCAALRGPFDLIVANPPYIASGTIADLAAEVRAHDPAAALDGGADGLRAYRAILRGIAERPGLLARDGRVVLEIGFDQADAVVGLARAEGLGKGVVTRDLPGHPRVVTLTPV